MLTPQEIQDTKFEKALFGGYDMAQIDKFLDELLVDYTLLYKENAALKGKMRVLVDKIDEYRAVDEEMRKALYTAQMTAKDITEKAEAEAKKKIDAAESEAKKRGESLETENYANALKLKEMRDVCDSYAKSASEAFEKAMQSLSDIQNKEIDEYIKKASEEMKKAAGAFDIKLPEDIEEKPEEPAEEPTLELDKIEDIQIKKEEPEEKEPKGKLMFSDLKFGKDYRNQD